MDVNIFFNIMLEAHHLKLTDVWKIGIVSSRGS